MSESFKAIAIVSMVVALFVMLYDSSPPPVSIRPESVAAIPASKSKPKLTDTHIRAAQLAIAEHGFPVASLRQNGSIIRAEVELTNQPPINIGDYAQPAAVAMRNAIYMSDGSDFGWMYKLTIYGPPPRPGFVQVIGVVKVWPSGKTEWVFGKPS